MKRILSLLTVIAVICCSMTFGVYADEGFDTGVLDFNNAADITEAVAQLNGTGCMTGAEVQNANTAGRGTVSVTDVDEEFGKSIEIKNGGDGYATLRIMGTPVIKGNAIVGFSVKKTGIGETFGCAMKIGSDSYPLIFEADGYIYLCKNKMVKYEPNVWYDIELAFNPINTKKAYLRLSVKKHNDGEQNTYDTFFINGFWDAVPSNMTAGISNIDFVYLGKNEESTYIDNIRCRTEGAEKITQTMNSMNDDFSKMPSFSHGSNDLSDYAKQWRTYNFEDRCTPNIKEVDGRKVLAMSAQGKDAYYVTIGKLIRDLPEDTTSVIKFGLGMSDTSAAATLITDDANTAIFNFASELGGTDGIWPGFEPGKIYDFQYVYNKQLGVSKILTVADGNVYEADTDAQLSQSIDFQFNIPANGEVYLADFGYDIVGDDCKVTGQYIKSGFETANLDDTIVFEYDMIISDKSDIVCGIREKGETDYKDCPAEIKLDKIQLKPENMKTDTEYEVRISGAASIFGTSVSETEYSFKTADFDIKANAPSINDGKISAFICSAYSNAKPVTVIALTSDGIGNLLESESFTVEADNREGKEYILSPSFTKPYDKIKLFVWNDIINAVAYSPSAEYGGKGETQPETGDGSEPISEVRLDKDNGKLYISGYNNSDKYNTAVIEVLKDGVEWSGDGKSLDNYNSAEENILDYLCYFTQIDNLGKNKPYTVAINYVGEKMPKLMVRFGRDSAVYFDNEIIERVNGAKTADELKEILLGNDYVKGSIGEIYAERINSEEIADSFWNTFLERKNKAYGTDEQFSTMYRIVEALKDNVNLTILKNADTADKMHAAVLLLKQDNMLNGKNSFDLYFGEGTFADKDYLTAESKNLILEKLIKQRNSYENTASFINDFAVDTLLYSVYKNSSKHNVYDIILNSDLITKSNISEFAGLKKVNQIEVCDKINNASEPYKSVNALENAIRSFAAEYSGNSGGGGSGSGGGSGNKGGSGGVQVSAKTEQNTVPITGNTDAYNDLDSVPWAKTAINALSGKNIVSGTGNGKFSPSDTVKREEFVKMLMGIIKVNDVKKAVEFSDADKSSWYWEYIRKAAANEIVLGIGGSEFGIGREVTREEMAAMIYRAATSGGLDIPRNDTAVFSDFESISDYAREACAFMSETGIMNGKSGGIFDPKSPATRAEAAKVIYELLLRTEASK